MGHVRLLCTNRSAFALAGLTLLLAGPAAHAQQFVLFDATFTFTKEDADNSKPSKSHYYVRGKMLNADRPKDWTSPVDYRNGTVHIRAEVIEKPEGGAPTTWTLCYIPNKGLKAGYGCTGTEVYKEKGVYERDVKMTDVLAERLHRLGGGDQGDAPGDEGRQRRQRPRPQADRPGEVLPDQDADHHDPGREGGQLRPETRAEPAREGRPETG